MDTDPVAGWLDDPDPATFPYDPVVAAYHAVGKHFVAEELLRSLSLARDRLTGTHPDGTPERATLLRFLDVALDKFDRRYDYPTYIAADVLDLTGVVAATEADEPWGPYDRRLVGLAADAMEFELAALDGRTDLLPRQRPAPAVVAKRCRHAVHAVAPALARLGLADRATLTASVAAARRVPAVVAATQSDLDRRVLQLSMLPVYVCHDEYLFIRVLQMFETTFALLAGQLSRAVRLLAETADWAAATRCVHLSRQALRESAPLFSLLATMQVESFRTFRAYTEGASAIQSRGYKLVESLCAAPDPARLHSVAYESVPQVRERILTGRPTLEAVFAAVRAAGRIPPAGVEALTGAMGSFADALRRWRQTHYRLAVRMLGERSGTGYTEGTPYLRAVRDAPVFPTVAVDHEVGYDGQRRSCS